MWEGNAHKSYDLKDIIDFYKKKLCPNHHVDPVTLAYNTARQVDDTFVFLLQILESIVLVYRFSAGIPQINFPDPLLLGIDSGIDTKVCTVCLLIFLKDVPYILCVLQYML